MYRVVTSLFISISLFFIFHSVSYAALTPEAQECLIAKKTYWNQCDPYITDTITCLDRLDKTNFVWSCQDFDGDSTIDPITEVPQCAQNFASEVCNNLGGLSARTCHDVCNDPAAANPSYISKLQGTYTKKYNERTTSLATPTPTPNPGSVWSQDTCLQAVDTAKDCRDNMIALDRCYDTIPPESGVWSCTKVDGTELSEDICRRAFILRIQKVMKDKIFSECIGDFPDGTSIVSYGSLEFKFKMKRLERVKPTITPTPGILDPDIYKDIDKDADPGTSDTAGEILNCGFANADTEAQQRCCPKTIEAIDFKNVTNRENCGWFDFSCGSLQAIQSYIIGDVLNPHIEETRKKYNTIIQQNGGALPECFVGNCDTAKGICKPEDGSAICYKYVLEGRESAFTQCTQCMQFNTNEGAKKMFYSAIGCIDTSFEGIVSEVFSLGIGAAGMIALGCIIYSAFIMQTSMGNPEQLQKTQENVTSCITGLILIILSIFILRILGVDILRIPGFGS